MSKTYMLKRNDKGLYSITIDGKVVVEDLELKQAITFIEASMDGEDNEKA